MSSREASSNHISVGDPPRRKLNEYRSREVAEELCLMDSELLRKIDAAELQNGAWMKKDKKYSLAPNIMAMVSSFNQLALLIPSEILEEQTPHARAKVISSFIKIASKCHSFGNYNSLKAVLAGLQCTPIFRLKKTWKEVSSKKRKRFQYLCDLLSEDSNWQLYREEVTQKLQTQSPLIPFLGIFLTTVALSQEADNLVEVASLSSRESVSSQKRRDSLYENYVILEAVTVRKKLEKLRRRQSLENSTLSRRSTISSPDPDPDSTHHSSDPAHHFSDSAHHSSDPAPTSDPVHSSILHDSEDSDPDDLESAVSGPIPKPLLSDSKPKSLLEDDEYEQDKRERTSEMRFSFSKDDEIRLVTSPLTKDMRSNSISTPKVPIIHSEEEEESDTDTEETSTAAPSSTAEDEEPKSAQSAKSTKADRETPFSEYYAEIKSLPTSSSKSLPAQVDAADEQKVDTTKREKVEHSATNVLTSSMTKDDESSKLRSVRSPLLGREDASAGATTSYVCTNGGMVFAYKRPSSCEIDGSAITEIEGRVSPAGKRKAEKPKKKLSSSSNPGDPAHHSPHNQRTNCADQSSESNQVSGRFSPRRMAKSLRSTMKEGGKKTKVTISSLRIRKTKLRESILPDKPVEPVNKPGAGRKLSGSLECLIDAVKKEDFCEIDPFAGELSRSASMFNVSVDLDEDSEVDHFSPEVDIDRSISVTSDRSLRTESQTSNESLQRLEEDCDSDDPPVVLRRLKRSSVHGFYDPQEYHQQQRRPPPPLPSDEFSASKKLEHRHSLKTIKEDKQLTRFTRHVRNKSDTSMLPPFRPPSGSKSPSTTPKSHQHSFNNLFQSLQEHLKSTISMPNVFRRERHSRPIVSELAPPEISKDTDPITLLIQYQFLSLRCCPGVKSRPELRALLLSAPHNSEGQNYKLSFEREPN